MDKIISEVNRWENTNIQVFWGEIAPCDHLVQIYENDKIFLDTLEGFAGTGLLLGDSVVVIATASHINSLNTRLLAQGFDLTALAAADRYMTMEATDTLSRFMVNNWPDEDLFNRCISSVLDRAGKDGRKVRAFGEMVAVLWAQGLNGATVQLENLWHKLHRNRFTLYCAYPRSGFTQAAHESIACLCNLHSKVIDGQARPATEIYYRSVK
ncbi:MAG: MEDS domain-containing protein [Bacteroidota bacterium]